MNKRFWILTALPALALVWLAVGSVSVARAGEEEVKVVVKEKMEGDGRGFLGVVPRKLDHVMRAALDYEGPGVLLAEVVTDGPSEKAGLEVGDILVELNGTPVHDGDRLQSLMKKTKPGQEVDLKLLRKGKTKSVKVVLGERPGPRQWFGDAEGLEGLEGLKGLQGLEGLRGLEGLAALEGLGDMDFRFSFDESDLEDLESDLREMELDLQGGPHVLQWHDGDHPERSVD